MAGPAAPAWWLLREAARRLLVPRRVPVPVPVPRPVPAPAPPIPRPLPPAPPIPVPPGPVPGPTPGTTPTPGTVPGNPPVAGPEAIPQPETMPGYEAPTWEGTQTNMGDMVRAENRTRRRERSCCNPFIFRHVWITPGTHIGGYLDQRIFFNDDDFTRVIPGNAVPRLRGWHYQASTCGLQEWVARSAAGDRQEADGEMHARCWLREAKYQMPLRSSPPGTPYTPNPTELGRHSRQFARYGRVCNNPAPPAKPCWHIGLEVVCSRMGGPIAYYLGLLRANNIEGIVRWMPIPQEAAAELDRIMRDFDN